LVEPIWVAVLNISERTALKISSLHHLDPEEVRSALVCVSGLDFSWHEHPERGLRAMVKTSVNGAAVLAVLYPASDSDPDVWNLGSAYQV
jgi:hypothetical protein